MNTDRFKKIIKYSFTSIGVILLIATLLGYTNLRNLPTTENKKTQYLTIGKERIRCFQKGTGKDVLLIHGTPGSIEDWNGIIDSLSKDYMMVRNNATSVDAFKFKIGLRCNSPAPA